MHKELKDSLNYIFEKEKLHEIRKPSSFNRKQQKLTSWLPTIVSVGIVFIAIMIFWPLVMGQPANIDQESIQHGSHTEGSEIFNYKGAYIGDAASVGQISKYALGSQSNYGNGIQLFTTDEPYGMRIFLLKKMDPFKDVETIFTTASYLFTLVRNIDFVEFEYEDKVYAITKQDLEITFGLDYYALEDEETLRSIISELLSNEQTKDVIHQLIKETTIK
ncbi:hypothetical protein UACE39S_06697 [Ureibacillus acetophenoni]